MYCFKLRHLKIILSLWSWTFTCQMFICHCCFKKRITCLSVNACWLLLLVITAIWTGISEMQVGVEWWKLSSYCTDFVFCSLWIFKVQFCHLMITVSCTFEITFCFSGYILCSAENSKCFLPGYFDLTLEWVTTSVFCC